MDELPEVRIESLLSARLFLVPQIVGDRIYFISNLSGRNSLYVMDFGGSVPEPLLPPHIALQNPHLMPGLSFVVFPKADKLLVMIDEDGDEVYQPMFIPPAVNNLHFTKGEDGLLFTSILFEDTYGPGFMPLDDPQAAEPVTVEGLAHEGHGELETIEHVRDDVYTLEYNIDGSSWLYEAAFDEAGRTLQVRRVLVGEEPLSGGVLESVRYEGDYSDSAGRYALSFSTAVSPTQIYTVGGKDGEPLVQHTNEKILGIPRELLSPGEEYAYTSFDGLRVSARLYRPAEALGYEGARPLVYYVHGGPQGQERPDFAWFSMPLIQFLTLKGFAVFVPNVRGSTGYGFEYMDHVVRDWGGQDRLDHVHAMTEVLPQDDGIDVGRAGVVGRSYGGYMTLTLAGRHPQLWSAAVDMFGPYNLLTFADRVPETWKPYVTALVGDPQEDREFLIDRSPRTHLHNLQCPLLVIQGKNDPRVREVESRDLVEELRDQGKAVEYLMLEDEGHDILKFDNRVRVYNAIADFFVEHLS